MGFPEVSAVLWRERELLELLLFKLEMEQLLLSAAHTRWLPYATREVEIILEEIRETELTRAVAVQGLAAELGLEGEPSLRDLAAAAEQPWQDLFEDHRTAFLTLTQEISDAARTNREVLLIGQRASREALLGLTDSVATYDPRGRASQAGDAVPARLVDRAL